VASKTIRRGAYELLDPRAWPKPGISPVNIFIVTAILISIVIAIIDTEASVHAEFGAAFVAIELALGVVFLVEYLCRLWSAAESSDATTAIGKRIKFATTPSAIIDVVVILFMLLPFALEGGAVMRIIRLLRIFTLAKLGRLSRSIQLMTQAIARRRYELFLTFLFAVMMMVCSATALYYAEGKHQPEEFGSIPRALWWSIITLTTVGYGDVSPITGVGKFFAAIVALLGIGLVAMPAGIFAAAFSDAIQQAEKEKKS